MISMMMILTMNLVMMMMLWTPVKVLQSLSDQASFPKLLQAPGDQLFATNFAICFNICRADDRSDYEYYDDYSASHRDYGHSYGHDDHHSSGYGHDDHGSYGGGHGHGGYGGYKVQPKKPGPYGYPSPNFKCEKSSETLYVTETEMTYDKKCYNIYKTKCQDGYDEGKVCFVNIMNLIQILYMLQGIGYQKHCNEFTVTRCRTVFDTSSEERCWTVYKKQCDMIYETVVDYEYEQKCSVSYEEECHGYGYHQECEKVLFIKYYRITIIVIIVRFVSVVIRVTKLTNILNQKIGSNSFSVTSVNIKLIELC